jgi:hypothetical protein
MPVVVAGAEGEDESVGEGILCGRAAAAVPLSSDEWMPRAECDQQS